ncbi:MAG: SDR family oxidoreductase [Rhodospirillaceae bacterium]|nr:SDR family oxidoreductase [Rhodospirillaceae bacterium]
MTRPFRFAAVLALLAAAPAAADTVFVAGATGRTGQGIVRELVAQGFDVIALTRDASRAPPDLGSGVRWVTGDVRDIDSLRAGMAGADVVVSAIGARQGRGPNSPEFVDFAGTRNLVDAAKENGVRQFVLIASGRTGPHIDHTTHRNMGYTRHFKTKGEEHLKASGVPYTILGAAGLIEQGKAPMGIRLFSRADYAATTQSTDETVVIAIPDIAQVVAAALRDPAARNKAFAVMNDANRPRDGWRGEFAATSPAWP